MISCVFWMGSFLRFCGGRGEEKSRQPLFFLASMGDSRPMRMAEAFTRDLLWFGQKSAAVEFCVLRLLCLLSILPSMDLVWLTCILMGFAALLLSRYERLLKYLVLILIFPFLFWLSLGKSKRTGYPESPFSCHVCLLYSCPYQSGGIFDSLDKVFKGSLIRSKVAFRGMPVGLLAGDDCPDWQSISAGEVEL